ncbi:hypothetical protein [Actinophytocola glycyrrhizae]|uniref:Uncharacterized protein n=1 Tax=Actinophytocola glycyrrhizae TaxID=2044873 RepID=A0ABV9S1W5_9PSEU
MTRARGTTALLAVLLGVVLGGCGSSEAPPPTTSTAATPAADEGLRPVRMTGGRALGYVQDDTASQILCQVLGRQQWEQLLSGPVGRRPSPGAGCRITTGHGMVDLSFRGENAAFAPSATVADRPATVEQNSFGMSVFTLVIADDTPRPLLRLEMVAYDDGPGQDVGTRVLDEIVPLLTKDGEPLPEIDDQGNLAYAGTPLTADEFVDLPTPVQALQLCTVLQEQLGIQAEHVRVDATGRCTLSTAQGPVAVEAQAASRSGDFTNRIAGRPAWTPADPPVATVLLRDDTDVALYVSSPDSVGLAEQLVPLLTG